MGNHGVTVVVADRVGAQIKVVGEGMIGVCFKEMVVVYACKVGHIRVPFEVGV